MRSNSTNSGRRKGLTLSISREKQLREQPSINLSMTQPLKVWINGKTASTSGASTARPSSPSARSKIIYKMRKSEWDVLQ